MDALLSVRPSRGSEPEIFSPCSLGQLGPSPRPATERHLLLLGRNFLQWRRPTQQGEGMALEGVSSGCCEGRVDSRASASRCQSSRSPL